MRKLLLVGAAAALGATACAPEIDNQAPADVVVAQFDPTGVPAVVPSPNDLALDSTTGLVKAPIDPNATPAMQEFTRDYLNTLNGFPTAAPATAKIVDLDPSSITPQSVRFIDMYAGTPIATAPVTPTITYDDATDTLRILPPATGWPKGARYAVALVGGANGLKGTNGRPVVGSATWAFARSAEPLVTCEDLTAPDCQTATELIPSTKTDPAERLRDQTASALRLEQLRRAYKPLLEALEKQDVKREDVALLWTFSIVNQPEATFDLTRNIIPFPNDLLRRNGRLALPTAGLTEPQLSLFNGLNTLDGWSTTAPIVSENSADLGVLESGSRLDSNTLATGTRFLKLGGPAGGTPPNVEACLNCAPSGASTGPQQLQFVPRAPLDERSQYAALLTTDLKDERGRRVMAPALFALIRLANPLVDANGKSTVSVISDAQANLLEPVRQGFKPLFDGLEAGAKIPRSKIALGWAFTTQSTVSQLKELHAFPATANLPTTPGYIIDISSVLLGLPNENLSRVFEGQFIVASPAPLQQGRMLVPPVTKPRRIPFMLAIPAGTMPQGGWPVAIFGHGLTGSRVNMLGIANTLAAPGYARATIAIDAVGHGERSNCATISPTSPAVEANGNVITSPNGACADVDHVCDTDVTSDSYGRCIMGDRTLAFSCDPANNGDVRCRSDGLGLCRTTDNQCEGGSFKLNAYGSPAISGWNFINLGNLFATRDNLRQNVADLAQLHRVLNDAGFNTRLTAANGGDLALNAAQVDYVGQSLGGLLGTPYTAVAPEVRRSALNTTGGGLPDVLLTSPAFATRKAAFLQGAGLTEGTPRFNEFIGLVRTILDPADPWNYAYQLEHGQAAEREAFIQYIQQDHVIPNSTTANLISAANRSASDTRTVASYMFKFASESTMPVATRHGFLLDPTGNATVTGTAQMQVVNFLATGNVSPTPETF